MDKRVFLWALAGWFVFGVLGATAILSSQPPPEQILVAFLMPGVFGMMVGGMLGLVRRYKANQRELGRFLLTVIGGTVLLGSLFVQLCHALAWPGWIAPVTAALGGFAGLVLSLKQFRQPLARLEGMTMLGATMVLGYDSFGIYIVPILVISAMALRHHLQKQPKC